MKVISWNINGIRKSIKEVEACVTKHQPDILCLQETKVVDDTVKEWLEEMQQYYPYQYQQTAAVKAGYSGTLCLSKERPLRYQEGFEIEELDGEGRLQTMEFADFALVNAYLPSVHAKTSLERQSYRMRWDDALIERIEDLKMRGEVLLCGDLNAAHAKEDMSSAHQRYEGLFSGFVREDDQTLLALLELGLVDTFRKHHPERRDAYTWWSNKNGKREKNQGCRLDYILVSKGLTPYVENAEIHRDVQGSDHCPIEARLDL